MTDTDPTRCASCGSEDIYYDPTDGWSCHACHRTDADE